MVGFAGAIGTQRSNATCESRRGSDAPKSLSRFMLLVKAAVQSVKRGTQTQPVAGVSRALDNASPSVTTCLPDGQAQPLSSQTSRANPPSIPRHATTPTNPAEEATAAGRLAIARMRKRVRSFTGRNLRTPWGGCNFKINPLNSCVMGNSNCRWTSGRGAIHGGFQEEGGMWVLLGGKAEKLLAFEVGRVSYLPFPGCSGKKTI